MKNRGITLVALVITIIILLILAGISISALTNQGLFGKAKGAKKKSSLLFGIQWDLVCKFLETKTDLSIDDIKSDSTNWGNYKNASLKLYTGKYNIEPWNSASVWNSFHVNKENYVTDFKTSSDENYNQLLTTGASEQTNKMNIFDLAGNEWEWTLEHGTSNTDYPCVARGQRI